MRLLSNVSTQLRKQFVGSCNKIKTVQSLNLHLHEFQSLALMQKYGVNVPKVKHITPNDNPEQEAINLSKSIGQSNDSDFVVKAQVLSGGRGLGYFKENNFKGGVHIASSPKAVKDLCSKMIGNTLITKQTGEAGKPCNSVLIAERFYIRQERYVAILMDRLHGGPILLGSSIGGTSIEDIAHSNPECIIKVPVDIVKGLTEDNLNEFVNKLGFAQDKVEEAKKSIRGLYNMFVEKDCLLVEANPFAETHDGRVLVCDAKVTFDDNAKFRHEDIFALQDHSQEDPREVEAAKFDLNYVGLDGNIGCMVNGAGLAMATMDILHIHGGKPANFLDVGGGANNKQIVEALRILENDQNIKSIFINIFGGIMRCDIIAKGVIDASSEIKLTKPIVIRLEGTNQAQAKELLDSSGIMLFFESDFARAAQKAVDMAKLTDLANKSNIKVAFSA